MSKNPDNLNLEQLLEIKRAEKPAAEFWDGFQKEFRQRQLQTLMQKESAWSGVSPAFFARSGIWVPVSAFAAALFALAVIIPGNSPIRNEKLKVGFIPQVTPDPAPAETIGANFQDEVVEPETFLVVESALPASFVMDLIPNDEPESLPYTREFPTSTIPAEKRAVSALVSYTLAHDAPTFGMAGRPQSIGF